jgi:hypothetical protein
MQALPTRFVNFLAHFVEPNVSNWVLHRMPRFSWSLAAALSMSAIAVFRPEIGSKSFAANAARSFSRVVESLAQRLQSGGVRVESAASPSDQSKRVGATIAQAQYARDEQAVSAPSSAAPSSAAPSSAAPSSAKGRLTQAPSSEPTTASREVASVGQIESFSSVPSKYASPPTAYFSVAPSVASNMTLASDPVSRELTPQLRERLWKDCAVSAICSGVPGPVAMLRSTPQAPGNPPSV